MFLCCLLLLLLQVVRCFEDDDIVHVSGKVDPLDDIDVINLELALADLSQIEKRLDRLRKGEQHLLLLTMCAADADYAAATRARVGHHLCKVQDRQQWPPL
jgi:ribosome-binding ATPase YchF (GTP1/OBG family)